TKPGVISRGGTARPGSAHRPDRGENLRPGRPGPTADGGKPGGADRQSGQYRARALPHPGQNPRTDGGGAHPGGRTASHAARGHGPDPVVQSRHRNAVARAPERRLGYGRGVARQGDVDSGDHQSGFLTVRRGMSAGTTLSLVSFVAASSLSTLIALLFIGRNRRLDGRLQDLVGQAPAPTPPLAVAQITRKVLPKIGVPLIPTTEKENSRLRTRLIHAGFYSRHAMVVFL